MVNHLYRGAFDYPHKSIVLYRPAKNEKHAWVRMCNFIAKKDGVDAGVICRMFDWEKNRGVNFNIKLEIEFQEVDE